MHSQFDDIRAQQYTLLVIEDEQPILELLGEALTEEGLRVTLAPDLPAALAALDRDRFDLVLANSLAEFDPEFALDQWPALEAIKTGADTSRVVIFSAHPGNISRAGRRVPSLASSPSRSTSMSSSRRCISISRWSRPVPPATIPPRSHHQRQTPDNTRRATQHRRYRSKNSVRPPLLCQERGPHCSYCQRTVSASLSRPGRRAGSRCRHPHRGCPVSHSHLVYRSRPG
jgi:CheY-like chemotaxis protein